MGEAHRWALVTITHLDERAAARMAEVDQFDRQEQAAVNVNLGAIEVIRGPICLDCRVHWSDVHRATTPWPCAGERPKALGGPLVPPQEHRSRQQRRREQRSAVKAERRAS